MSVTGTAAGGRDGASSGPARSPLLTQVLGLVVEAADAYRGTPQAAVLDDVMARLARAAAGRHRRQGEGRASRRCSTPWWVSELAPTDAGECTRIVTWYRHGTTYRVTLMPPTGSDHASCPSPARRARIDVELGGLPADVEHLDRRVAGAGADPHDADRHAGHRVDLDRHVGPQPGVPDPRRRADQPVRRRRLPAPPPARRRRRASSRLPRRGYAQPSPVNAWPCCRAPTRSPSAASTPWTRPSASRSATADPRLRRLVQRCHAGGGLLAQAGADLRELEFRRLRTAGRGGPGRDRGAAAVGRPLRERPDRHPARPARAPGAARALRAVRGAAVGGAAAAG